MAKGISKKLRKFLDRQKGIPMSDKDLMELVDRKAKVVLYEDLYKFKTINELFGNKQAIFLMYQQSPNWGHWTALLRRAKDKEIEFFDPLGIYPDKQLAWTSPDQRKQLNMDEPHLTRLLETAPPKWKLVYNKTKFQKDKKKVNSCGRWTALRVLMRKFNLKKFTDYFKTKSRTLDSDDIATMLTTMKLDKE